MHELLVTLAIGRDQQDLRLTVDDDMPAVALLRALAPFADRDEGTFTVGVARSRQTIDPADTLRPYELRAGDQLAVVPLEGGWPAPPTDDEPPMWALRVEDGPAAGELLDLPAGRAVIGRAGEDGVAIDLGDSAVSRRHAELTAGDALTVRDLGSRNGTWLNGSEVGAEAVTVERGDRIEVGYTVLVVQAPRLVVDLRAAGRATPATRSVADDRLVIGRENLGSAGHLSYDEGTLKVNVPPRVVQPEPRVTRALGHAPETPPKRRFPLASAIVPVVMGGTMALLFNPLFALFMAASPLMAIWTYLDDRRTGRNDFQKRRAEYLAGLEAEHAALAAAKDAGLVWRHAEHPPAGVVTSLATRLAPGLWLRRPRHHDFLDVRVGVADQPALVTATVEDRGDPELLAAARAVADGFVVDPGVPAVVPLHRLGVIGIAGPHLPATEVARWLTVQLAVQQSERDVALVILAPTFRREWSWAKWLPHAGRLTHHGRTVAATDGDVAALFEGLRALADRRAHADDRSIGAATKRYTPHVVVIVQPPLRLSARDVAAFVEVASSVGFSIVWIDDDRSSLPRECGAIVDVGADGQSAQIVFTEGGGAVGGVRRDHFSIDAALTVARALAPLRDASGSGEGEDLPARVDLVDLYHPAPDTAPAVVDRWRQVSARDLGATVGATVDGPLRLDLRKDGPHGLVAGTTGAGKSELLQSLVAALAVEHPPSHLNFVLVDYKGGAAFKEAKDLPHTVGFVTDLDAHLTRRALTSLNAELRRRERTLAEHGAKDLLDLIERSPEQAPPSLLIVIDEFAALKTEVPEFVDGVIDIGQRGRSLGVHLLLATQKPGGVITAAIQANTNLRIALRVADGNESAEVIGRKDAADIDRALPGRGFVRTGPTEIRGFQSAYVGGPSRRSRAVHAVVHAASFGPGFAPATQEGPDAGTGGPTDLENIVQATNDAARALGLGPARKPWLPVLATKIPWRAPAIVPGESTPGLAAPIGEADLPEQQRQEPFVLDLDQLGHLIVYGGAGAGKTTFLRTVAASLTASRPPDDLHLYGIDFAGHGLAPLARLPHCGGVVTGEDIDRLRRLVAQLSVLADERKAQLGAVGASSLPEYRRATGTTLPYVLVLVDGFGEFRSVTETLDRGQHLEAFGRLVTAGRGVGLHVVLTADRRGAVPPNLMSTIAGRAVLPMANPDELLTLGLPELAKSPPVDPGRAFFGDVEVQVAVLADGDDTGGNAQSAALGELGDRLRATWGAGDAAAIRLLPEEVPVSELPRPTERSLRLPVGLAEDTLQPVSLQLDDDPVLLVAGPDRSGRTNALAVVAQEFEAAWPDAPRVFIATRRNPLLGAALWTRTALGAEPAAALVAELTAALDERAATGGHDPLLIVLDDAEELADTPAAMGLDRILRRARDASAVVVVGLSAFRAKGFAPWLQTLRNARHGILLQPHDDDGDIVHLRLPRRSGLALPPGRGYLVHRGSARLVQMARVDTDDPSLPTPGTGRSLSPEDTGTATTKERDR